MRTFICGLALLTLLTAGINTAMAQEGHPFVGTWRGRLVNSEADMPVVLIISYNGDSLQGMINPGRNSFPFQSVEHDAADWKLSVTAVNKQNESIGFTGVMHEIGSRDRYLEGSWTQAGKDYTFKITRE